MFPSGLNNVRTFGAKSKDPLYTNEPVGVSGTTSPKLIPKEVVSLLVKIRKLPANEAVIIEFDMSA